MTKFCATSIILLVCLNVGLAQSRNQASAQEKKELFQLILKDKQAEEYIKDYGLSVDDLAKEMSVKKIDLNTDGQPEYIVALEEEHICGAHADCPDWVYRKTGSEYQLLLRTFGQQLSLEETLTNKFRDLRSEGADSSFEGSFTIYQFDGKKYQAKACYTRVYKAKGKKGKIIPRKCEENGEEKQ